MPRHYRDSELVGEYDEEDEPLPLTPEAREMQLANMAYKLTRKRIRNGTASAAEVIQCLKYGSRQYQAELENLRIANELAKAKIKSLESQVHQEELLQRAISAMTDYSGTKDDDEFES